MAESIKPPTDNGRPFEYQAAVLRRNKQVIELQCQKFKGVRSRARSELKREDPSSAPSTSREASNLGVLHAATVSHLQTGKEALRSILPLLESRPDDIGLLLTIIQLYIQTENPAPALSLLEALFRRLEAATTSDHADVRFSPGLVALAVALYRLQGRHAAVRAELSRAAAHWQHQSSARRDDGSALSLLRQAGIELLHSQDASDLSAAGDAFSRLCEEQRDRLAEAGLVASFATSDPARAQPYLADLTPIEKLTAGVDVAALLDAGVASLPASSVAAPVAGSKKRGASAAADGSAPAKKPRRSRAKLPKDYDPEKKPDPERWLPLRDRSTYRPKGKKGKKRAAEATQGGVVKEEETLELVGGAGAVKVEKAPQGAAGGKKKKGKK
jgi:signal recognition particle subunit SRP72